MFTTAAAPANLAPVRPAARRRAMSTSPSIPDRSAGPVPPELSGERLLVGFVAAVGVVVLSVAPVALLGGRTAALVGAFALLLVMTVAIVVTILRLLADVPADRRADPGAVLPGLDREGAPHRSRPRAAAVATASPMVSEPSLRRALSR